MFAFKRCSLAIAETFRHFVRPITTAYFSKGTFEKRNTCLSILLVSGGSTQTEVLATSCLKFKAMLPPCGALRETRSLSAEVPLVI